MWLALLAALASSIAVGWSAMRGTDPRVEARGDASGEGPATGRVVDPEGEPAWAARRDARVQVVDGQASPLPGVALVRASTGEVLAGTGADGWARLPGGLLPAWIDIEWPRGPVGAIEAAAGGTYRLVGRETCRAHLDVANSSSRGAVTLVLDSLAEPSGDELDVRAGTTQAFDLELPCLLLHVGVAEADRGYVGVLPSAIQPAAGSASLVVRDLPRLVVCVTDEGGGPLPDATIGGEGVGADGCTLAPVLPGLCHEARAPGRLSRNVCTALQDDRETRVQVVLPAAIEVEVHCGSVPCPGRQASCTDSSGELGGECQVRGGLFCMCPADGGVVVAWEPRARGLSGAVAGGRADLRPGGGTFQVTYDDSTWPGLCAQLTLVQVFATDMMGFAPRPVCTAGVATWSSLPKGRYLALVEGEHLLLRQVGPIDLATGAAASVHVPNPATAVGLDLRVRYAEAQPARPSAMLLVAEPVSWWLDPVERAPGTFEVRDLPALDGTLVGLDGNGMSCRVPLIAGRAKADCVFSFVEPIQWE
jgi:hypothetical protein